MRVLVALGGANGKVLSRDDLIDLCWDGTIVGDNAIKRVIFRLRHVLGDLSGGAVKVETITKVGFRLVVASEPPRDPPSPARRSGFTTPAAMPAWASGGGIWTRRAAAGGVVAAAGAALAYAVWRNPARHVPDPRAVEFYRRGEAIQKDGVFEALGEAIEAYKQAVATDPRYAQAWGALALSYNCPVLGPSTRLGRPEDVRAAARRALGLDPANADARLALIALDPVRQHWQEREAALRAFLRDHPASALGHGWLGALLLDVGRIDDAATTTQRAVGIDPARKTVWLLLENAYYLAGRDHDGDMAVEELRTRWPQDSRVYSIGYYMLLGGKRYTEARAYLGDSSRRPRLIRPDLVAHWMRQTDALASGRGIGEIEQMVRSGSAIMLIQIIEFTAMVMALLGMAVELFALLEAYFFGGEVNGTRVAPPGLLDPRSNHVLFHPALSGLRGDPRFASLLERTGLEDYWRKSGTQPDFRRG